MPHKPNWQVRWAKPEDESALLQLFHQAFEHEMPVEQWRWKYATSDPPGCCVLDGNQLIAFYGGMPRTIRIAGDQATAVQIGDVMVAPGQRGVFTRRGAMFRAAAQFSEDLVGVGKKYDCGYGFPSERHNRLGEHLGLYARIGKLQEAAWEPLSSRPSLWLSLHPIKASQLTHLSQLWLEMAESLCDKVVLERDATYLNHRFLSHPTVDYCCFLVKHRFTGGPVGLIVLRDHGANGMELLDIVAPIGRIPLLIKAAQFLTARLQRQRLFAWLSEAVAECVKETLPTLTDLNLPLPIIAWGRQRDLQWTRGKWWLIGGDTDFR